MFADAQRRTIMAAIESGSYAELDRLVEEFDDSLVTLHDDGPLG